MLQEGLRLGLTFGGDGAGRVDVSPGGAWCRSSCSLEIPYAANVQLTFVPDTGSIAAGCGGACSFEMTHPAARNVRFLKRGTVAAIASMALSLLDEEPEVFEDGFEPNQ